MTRRTLLAIVALATLTAGTARASYPYRGFRLALAPSIGYSAGHGDVYAAGALDLRFRERLTLSFRGGFLDDLDLTATLRYSWIRLVPATRRTFVRFDPQKIRFLHDPVEVKSWKPYVQASLGSIAAVGGGIEWQPVSLLSMEAGVITGVSFVVEEEQFVFVPHFTLRCFLF